MFSDFKKHGRRLGTELGAEGKQISRTKFLNDPFRKKIPFNAQKFLMTLFSHPLYFPYNIITGEPRFLLFLTKNSYSTTRNSPLRPFLKSVRTLPHIQ